MFNQIFKNITLYPNIKWKSKWIRECENEWESGSDIVHSSDFKSEYEIIVNVIEKVYAELNVRVNVRMSRDTHCRWYAFPSLNTIIHSYFKY